MTTTKQRSKPAKASIKNARLIFDKGNRRYHILLIKSKVKDIYAQQRSSSKKFVSWFDVKLSEKQKFAVKVDIAYIFGSFLSQ